MTAAGMERCYGCGFHVEREDVREWSEFDEHCETCKLCEQEPKLKESYRLGFNAGLDAVKEAVVKIAENSGLRKPIYGRRYPR